MMNSMRSFAGGFIAKLLMILLVISFGLWGVGDILRNTGPSYAARVGDETISINDFQQQKQQLARQIEAMGAKINIDTMDMGLLRKLVQQRLMTETMHDDLGLYVNDTLLMKTLRTLPDFKNPDGSFNSNVFRMVVKQEGVSEATLLKRLNDDTTTRFLLASLDMSDVTPPAPVHTLISTAALETRDSWIVSIAPVTLPAAPTDEEVHAFYDSNKSVLYAQPETRTIEYIALKPAQIDALSDKSITPDMLSDAEKAQPKASKQSIHDRLRTEQRDTVMHSFSGSVDDAIAGGANLSDAVTKAGIPAQSHILTDTTEAAAKASTDDVVKTVAEQGFQMASGETSGVIVTPKGVPVIVYVKSTRPAAPQEFEKVAADVRGHVNDQKRREATRARIQEVKAALSKLDEKQADDQQWQSVLKQFNLNPRRVTNLARPTDAKTVVNGIPAPLHQAIFERQVGTVAGPFTLENGGQMLAIVTNIHHPSAADVASKSNKQETKSLQELTANLNESVQTHAFESFANRHAVKVNPAFLKQQAPAEAATDEETP